MNNAFIITNILNLNYKGVLSYISNIKTVLIISLSLVVLLTVVYAIQYSSVMSLGFQIRNYETRIENLTQINKDLKVDLFNTISLSYIEEKAVNQGFERINNVSYIEVIDSYFVKNK